ncbi:MAG: ribosome rescue GTPase HflX [Pseudomonadota bacterium]
MQAQLAEIKRALTVFVDINSATDNHDVEEFIELVNSSGLEIVGHMRAPRQAPDAQYYIGKGKVDEIIKLATEQAADVIIINQPLSPAQERNLEKSINLRVIDRIGLILDIFAQRARTYEGKLQVELAQLQHLSTRLIRGWTHLERQKGGIGLRGPGETQLETDRRLIGQRIKMINHRLQKVRIQRQQSRQKRKKNAIPVISLVGYTNAGKSTLFNYLTDAKVLAADQLFATLDPTLRRIMTPAGRTIIMTDTVGFIQDLPPELVASFKATLDEVGEADILLHVIDVDLDNRQQRIDEVNSIINKIDATHVPQIEVYNKVDAHDNLSARIDEPVENQQSRIWLSARTGEGIDLLLKKIDELVAQDRPTHYLRIPMSAGQFRAKLFDLGAVRHEDIEEQGSWLMEIELEDFLLNKLCDEAKLDVSELQTR